jgi:predicted dehydrogenase
MKKTFALIGYGYWGPNLLRNLLTESGGDVLYVCDVRKERLDDLKKKYPKVRTILNYKDILSDKKVDAIVIATPTKTHYKIAKESIMAGKDVLIEKPATSTYNESKKLINIANKKGKIIMVDHTFLFNKAVHLIKSLIEKGELGDILYIDAERANLGIFQEDTNVIYDLAAHDFSIIQFLLDKKAKNIAAHGSTHFGKHEDIAHIMINYPDNIFAHIHVSWLCPLKLRRMIVVGTKKMLVYDENEPVEKIKIYDKGVVSEKDFSKRREDIKINYRTGDAWLPKIDISEPLSLMIKEFAKSISDRTQPISDVVFGSQIVNALEVSTKSLRTGKRSTLKYADK